MRRRRIVDIHGIQRAALFESSRNEHPSIAEDRQRLSRARRRQGTGRLLEAAFRGIVNLKRGDGLAADFTASNQRLPVIQKDDRCAGLTWGRRSGTVLPFQNTLQRPEAQWRSFRR